MFGLYCFLLFRFLVRENRAGLGLPRMSADDIFQALDPLDQHKKNEAKLLWYDISLQPNGTKQLIHAMDHFLSLDERFLEMIRENRHRYEKIEPYIDAIRILDEIKSAFNKERLSSKKCPPWTTMKLISQRLEDEERKEKTMFGEEFLVCDGFCITLAQLKHYLDENLIAFCRA